MEIGMKPYYDDDQVCSCLNAENYSFMSVKTVFHVYII